MKNSDIRYHARNLLDSNIFSRDWLKSVVLVLICAAINSGVSGVLLHIANNFLLPFLITFLKIDSVILTYLIPVVVNIVGVLASSIVLGPLSVAFASAYIEAIRTDGKIRLRDFFEAFKTIGDDISLGFMYLLNISLWSCLFVIPGIYFALSYAMVFHVKHDNPDFTWQQCFDESERLMSGNRWKLLKLQLSFFFPYLLTGLVFCGIGALWVYPYHATSMAIFYEDIKAQND